MNQPMSGFSILYNNWFEKRTKILLWLSIGIYCLFFIGASIWKYYHFGYNALDLAIYNQVFYNTSLGHLFSFTIHPHSYLGDHLELFILLLVPFYSLGRHPITLLIFQTLAMAFSAWPLYLAVKKIMNEKLAFSLAFVFLINPFTQNINFFEFHILPFAIFFIFFSFYFYLENRFFLFLTFSFLALLIREDVALVIIMFSLLSFLEKKTKRWVITPLLMGLGWLVIALLVIPAFSHYQSYKFLFYYSWLGNSFSDIMANLFFHPMTVLSHIFSIQNIFFILALFLTFLNLPLLKPKYLLLSVLAFCQVLLAGFGSELVLKTHYSSLLIPGLFLATAASFAFILKEKFKARFSWQEKIKTIIKKEKEIFFILFFCVTGYAAFTFGPILPIVKNVFYRSNNFDNAQLKNHYLNFIPKEKSVTASYEFLTKLSGRKNIYSLHYAFVGKKQYSQESYELPDTDFLLVDTNDFLVYQVQYPKESFYQNAYSEGDNRLRSIIQKQNLGLIKSSDNLFLFEKNKENKIIPYQTFSKLPPSSNQKIIKAAPEINFLGWDYLETSENNNPSFELPLTVLPVSLYWQPLAALKDNLLLSLEVNNSNNQIIYQKYYPLGYGIFPTSEWPQNKIIETNYWFLIPDQFASQNNLIALKLVKLKENHPYFGLNGLLSAKTKNVKYEAVGEEIKIPLP